MGVFDFFFEPFELTVHTGDTVGWTAYGYGHAVIADNGVFDSFNIWPGAIPALSTFLHTFHAPGVYLYYSEGYGGPDGAGMSATITVTGSVTNQLPSVPLNQLPTNNATQVALRVELRGDAFADADPGDFHKSSQWIVRRASDNQTVYDSGEVSDNALTSTSKTNRFLPIDLLNHGTTYHWQVRYRDSFGGWSGYSAPTIFSTLMPSLNAVRSGTGVVFSWPTNSAALALEYSGSMTGTEWIPVAALPQVIAGRNTVADSPGDQTRFYRLRKL